MQRRFLAFSVVQRVVLLMSKHRVASVNDKSCQTFKYDNYYILQYVTLNLARHLLVCMSLGL